MRVRFRTALTLVVALAAVVAAAPHKVLVLPLDGDADPVLRARLGQAMHKLAKASGGQVTMGNTTFSETAAAVGCDPGTPTCADSVLSTLAVDEIVYGTATTVNGQTTVVIHRATKGAPPRELQITVGAQDPPDKIEAGLQPVFHPGTESESAGSAAPPGSGSGSGSGSTAIVGEGSGISGTPPQEGSGAAPGPPGPPVDNHDRNLGMGLAIGGGLGFVIGIALWASEQSLQTDINGHSTRTIGDIQDLKSIEDRASNYALFGNVMVIAGLAVGGVGGYYLYKHHKNHNATIAPAPAEHGAGMTLVIGGAW